MGDLSVGYINRDRYQTPQATRLYAQSAFMPSTSGPLVVRTGLLGNRDAATLTGATAMQCDVAAFPALIAGTESGDQGAYPVALRATKRLTFEAGESAINRVDRIIAHVYDNDVDGSGEWDGDVEVLKGDPATGAATALPPDSMLMYEVTVPAGASAGGSGIPWASAVADKRQWTTTAGGNLPVPDKAARDAIVAPHEGFGVFRIDLGVIETWDGAVWRTQGVPVLDSTGDLSHLDEYDGQLAVIGGDLFTRRSGSWVGSPRGLLVARQSFTGWPNGAANGVLDTRAVVGSAWPDASGETLPMQIDIDLDPSRTYKIEAFADAVDGDAPALYRAYLLRQTPDLDILTGIIVALQYGHVTSQTFGDGNAINMFGYADGVSGTWRVALTLEPYAAGSGKLRVGGYYSISISDVGPAGVVTTG